jgi:glycosyltransferase involved in cell wall biosynthesis
VRIGLDATWASFTGTGTASYTHGLIAALVQHGEHSFILYFRPGDELINPLYSLERPNVERRLVGGRGQFGRTFLSLSRFAAADRLDVFHSPGYFLPLWTGPKVVTFHDANMFLQWDKWWRPGMRLSWLALCVQTALSSRLARRVVTDSEYSAERIASVLRLRRAQLQVLYPGVDDRYFAAQAEGTDVRAQHDLVDYVLYVGVLSPQKNLEGVVRAFARLQRPGLKLVVVGREDGPYYRQRIKPLIQSLHREGDVVVLGVVPPNDLTTLYRGARALLYPSFAEGFGLPPLEAMAVGTPVIASNVTSLPEVLGNAAVMVDPTDTDAIACETDRLISDDDFRHTFVQRGRQRAARYRWSDTASRALAIYASVA